MDDFEHDRKYKGGIECFWAENSHNKSRIIWHQNGGELNNFNLSKQFWGWLKKKKSCQVWGPKATMKAEVKIRNISKNFFTAVITNQI